jgi:hypothetical protein
VGQVQADELSVKAVARRLGMALALAVPSRLWPGGGIRPRRDLTLLMAVARMVRAAARSLAILVGVAGLASYVTAFTQVVRDPERTGRRCRPRLVPTTGLLLGQVIKHRAGRCLTGVTRRVVRGTEAAIAAALAATGTGTGINTASIERLHATSRGALSPLVRRGRAIARAARALTAGMDLVGCADNFGGAPDSLRVAAGAG